MLVFETNDLQYSEEREMGLQTMLVQSLELRLPDGFFCFFFFPHYLVAENFDRLKRFGLAFLLSSTYF